MFKNLNCSIKSSLVCMFFHLSTHATSNQSIQEDDERTGLLFFVRFFFVTDPRKSAIKASVHVCGPSVSPNVRLSELHVCFVACAGPA
ncbi:hypothetical protein VNO80_04196 [Phaseolus coccineus]|uniref:Secreted protein n=1 Tax=Phaseolus coccineus TaxID=3886 RepID=A0AAN9NSZ7_PHACN